jgi:hypothetical protein
VTSAGAEPAIFLSKPIEFDSWHLEHGKQVPQGEGPLNFSLMGGKDRSFGADADNTSTFFKTDVLPPPPSYWIGLGRPPPAPNWQRFDDTVGRSRPPPKPNWCQLILRPPTHLIQSNLHSIDPDHPLSFRINCSLPPFPPISTTGSFKPILSSHRHVVSPGQTWLSLPAGSWKLVFMLICRLDQGRAYSSRCSLWGMYWGFYFWFLGRDHFLIPGPLNIWFGASTANLSIGGYFTIYLHLLECNNIGFLLFGKFLLVYNLLESFLHHWLPSRFYRLFLHPSNSRELPFLSDSLLISVRRRVGGL